MLLCMILVYLKLHELMWEGLEHVTKELVASLLLKLDIVM